MHIDAEGNYTKAVLKSKWKVENEQILIIGKSGSGKTIAMEGIAEELHELGYIVIFLTDFKNVIEFGFAMFEPEDPIHLVNLKSMGKQPSKKNVILYHPFTFNLPTNPSPDMRVFTFSLKSLTEQELGLLVETHMQSETIRVLKDGVSRLSGNDTLNDFLYRIKEMIEGQYSRYKGRVMVDANSDNFFTGKSTQATTKNIGEIVSYFKPFRRHYFFAPEKFSFNLDVEEEIFKHQEKYHVLVTNYIPKGEKKIKAFVILKFINEIVEKATGEKCKHPIAFIIDEIGNLTPYKSQGYQEFLASAFRPIISTIRSGIGRGGTSVMGTQVLTNVDEDVSEMATKTWIGQVNSNRDMLYLKKVWNYTKDTIDTISSLKIGRFILRGDEEIGGFRMVFPSHMHKEERYNFFEMYRKHYPFKLKKYSGLVKEMKKFVDESEDKIKKKVQLKQAGEMQSIDEAEKSKSSNKGVVQELTQVKEQRDELKQKGKDELKKRCYEMFTTSDPKLSYREIGIAVGLHHATVKAYINEYEEAIKQKPQSSNTQSCPECGGVLQMEHGKHGDFLGCSNSPKCKYTLLFKIG